MPQVTLRAEWPDGGSIWTGRNGKRFGGNFYLGLAGRSESASVIVPECGRKVVAKLLRRFADRLDPPEAS